MKKLNFLILAMSQLSFHSFGMMSEEGNKEEEKKEGTIFLNVQVETENVGEQGKTKGEDASLDTSRVQEKGSSVDIQVKVKEEQSSLDTQSRVQEEGSSSGVQKEIKKERTLDVKYLSSNRADWINANKLSYVREIQIHLGTHENLHENSSAHSSVLQDGNIINHIIIDQSNDKNVGNIDALAIHKMVHRLPRTEKKQILQDQFLIHINVIGDDVNEAQVESLKNILNGLSKRVPGLLTLKWCTSNATTVIPWLKDEKWNQYSDNFDLYKVFTLTNLSSEIKAEEFNGTLVYWVPSRNHYSRRNNVPNILNIFRTEKSAENTFISYMGRNKRTSAHFTIDEEGRIFQHIVLDEAAYFVTPSFGPLKLGQEVSFRQIVVGLTGELTSIIPEQQQKSLSNFANFISKKYKIDNWTTPVPASLESPVLGQELLPDVERLNGTHLTEDPKLIGKIKSLVYHYPSPKHSERIGNYKNKIDTVVLLHTFCSWDETLMAFSRNDDKAPTYHFTINQDGVIVQHVYLEKRAWHSGVSKDTRGQEKVNEFSIGIGLVNAGDCQDEYTEKQIQALNGLLEDLNNVLESLYQITTHQFVKNPGESLSPMGLPWEKITSIQGVKIMKHTDEEILKKEYPN